MKTKLNRWLIISAIFAAAALAGSYLYLSLMNAATTAHSQVESYTYKNILPPIDPSISDTLPYRKYIEKKQKIARTRALQNGTFLDGGGWTGWSVGTRSGYYCDTCTANHYDHDIPGVNQHYIVLKNWKLKQIIHLDSARFYSKSGKNHIRKTVEDKAKKHTLL